MTMINALDITINEKARDSTISNMESPIKEKISTESNVNQSEAQVGLAKESKESELILDFQIEKDSEEDQTSEGLWIKAGNMMGDIDDLGAKLKAEVTSSLKIIHERETSAAAQIRSLSNKLEQSEAEISSLRLNLTALQSGSDDQQREYDEELQRIDDLHKIEIKYQKDRIHELEKSVEAWTMKAGAISAELAINERTKEDKTHKHRLEKMIEDLQIKLNESSTANSEIQIENVKLKTEILEIRRQLSESEEKNAQLNNDLLSKDSDISDLNDKLQAMEDTHMTQLGELELDIEQLRARLTQESTDKEEYQKELENLIELNDNLQTKYKESKKSVKALEESLAIAKKASGNTISQNQLRYYQELEKKYVQAKK
jgi:predicted RNase H-like nuclease (RuvC/YqgF family)